MGYVGTAGVTAILPQGTPASGGRPPIKGAVMFLKREDLDAKNAWHASELFNVGDKVHIPTGTNVAERRKILGNQYVNGEVVNNQTISGTWTVEGVQATDQEQYFMRDNTRITPGGEDHVHTSDGTSYGIQGAVFEDYGVWTAGAGSAAVDNFGDGQSGDPLLRRWAGSETGAAEPGAGAGVTTNPDFQHALMGIERFQNWRNQKAWQLRFLRDNMVWLTLSKNPAMPVAVRDQLVAVGADGPGESNPMIWMYCKVVDNQVVSARTPPQVLQELHVLSRPQAGSAAPIAGFNQQYTIDAIKSGTVNFKEAIRVGSAVDLGMGSLVVQEEQSIQFLADSIDPANNANYLEHLLHKGVELDTTNLATTSIGAANIIHLAANFVGTKLLAHVAMQAAAQDFLGLAPAEPANFVNYANTFGGIDAVCEAEGGVAGPNGAAIGAANTREVLVKLRAMLNQVQPFTSGALLGKFRDAHALARGFDSKHNYNEILVQMRAVQDFAQQKSVAHAVMCQHGWAKPNFAARVIFLAKVVEAEAIRVRAVAIIAALQNAGVDYNTVANDAEKVKLITCVAARRAATAIKAYYLDCILQLDEMCHWFRVVLMQIFSLTDDSLNVAGGTLQNLANNDALRYIGQRTVTAAEAAGLTELVQNESFAFQFHLGRNIRNATSRILSHSDDQIRLMFGLRLNEYDVFGVQKTITITFRLSVWG